MKQNPFKEETLPAGLGKILLAHLIPDAKNPRKDLKKGDPEFEKISKSVEKFGQLDPIIFNTRTRKVIGGHQRLKVLDSQGYTELYTVTLGAYTWAFAEADLKELSDKEESAANIALNKAQGDWEIDQLTANLQELKLDDMLEFTGFDDKKLSKLLKSFESVEVIQDDFVQPSEIKTKIKSGDIIPLGSHRLMCGDSSDKNHVSLLLGGETPDLLYFDPPYEDESLWNCFIPARKTITFSDSRHIKQAISTLAHYKFIYEFVWDTVISWYLDNRPLCRHRSAFIGQDQPGYDSESAVINDGKHRKETDRESNLGEYTYKPLPEGQVRLTTVFQKSKADLPAEHGKPIEWIAPIIAGCHPKNVVDLFGGAGSTLIACEQIGVPCFIMEIEPVKCQLIVNRFEKYQKEKV